MRFHSYHSKWRHAFIHQLSVNKPAASSDQTKASPVMFRTVRHYFFFFMWVARFERKQRGVLGLLLCTRSAFCYERALRLTLLHLSALLYLPESHTIQSVISSVQHIICICSMLQQLLSQIFQH